jgi:hypothetical protein
MFPRQVLLSNEALFQVFGLLFAIFCFVFIISRFVSWKYKMEKMGFFTIIWIVLFLSVTFEMKFEEILNTHFYTKNYVRDLFFVSDNLLVSIPYFLICLLFFYTLFGPIAIVAWSLYKLKVKNEMTSLMYKIIMLADYIKKATGV